MTITLTFTLDDDADPYTTADAVFDYLCAAEDVDVPGVESFDNFDTDVSP